MKLVQKPNGGIVTELTVAEAQIIASALKSCADTQRMDEERRILNRLCAALNVDPGAVPINYNQRDRFAEQIQDNVRRAIEGMLK